MADDLGYNIEGYDSSISLKQNDGIDKDTPQVEQWYLKKWFICLMSGLASAIVITIIFIIVLEIVGNNIATDTVAKTSMSFSAVTLSDFQKKDLTATITIVIGDESPLDATIHKFNAHITCGFCNGKEFGVMSMPEMKVPKETASTQVVTGKISVTDNSVFQIMSQVLLSGYSLDWIITGKPKVGAKVGGIGMTFTAKLNKTISIVGPNLNHINVTDIDVVGSTKTSLTMECKQEISNDSIFGLQLSGVYFNAMLITYDDNGDYNDTYYMGSVYTDISFAPNETPEPFESKVFLYKDESNEAMIATFLNNWMAGKDQVLYVSGPVMTDNPAPYIYDTLNASAVVEGFKVKEGESAFINSAGFGVSIDRFAKNLEYIVTLLDLLTFYISIAGSVPPYAIDESNVFLDAINFETKKQKQKMKGIGQRLQSKTAITEILSKSYGKFKGFNTEPFYKRPASDFTSLNPDGGKYDVMTPLFGAAFGDFLNKLYGYSDDSTEIIKTKYYTNQLLDEGEYEYEYEDEDEDDDGDDEIVYVENCAVDYGLDPSVFDTYTGCITETMAAFEDPEPSQQLPKGMSAFMGLGLNPRLIIDHCTGVVKKVNDEDVGYFSSGAINDYLNFNFSATLYNPFSLQVNQLVEKFDIELVHQPVEAHYFYINAKLTGGINFAGELDNKNAKDDVFLRLNCGEGNTVPSLGAVYTSFQTSKLNSMIYGYDISEKLANAEGETVYSMFRNLLEDAGTTTMTTCTAVVPPKGYTTYRVPAPVVYDICQFSRLFQGIYGGFVYTLKNTKTHDNTNMMDKCQLDLPSMVYIIRNTTINVNAESWITMGDINEGFTFPSIYRQEELPFSSMIKPLFNMFIDDDTVLDETQMKRIETLCVNLGRLFRWEPVKE